MEIKRNKLKEFLSNFPKYHWDSAIVNIAGVESFIPAPHTQYCGPIKIEMETPVSRIFFKKNESIMALRCLELKVDPGMGELKADIYINNKIFNHKDVDKFYQSFFPFLLEKNEIQIKLLSNINFAYSKQILLYPIKHYDNDTEGLSFAAELWNKK